MQLRMRRIEGQIRGIINMLGEGKTCEQVVTQMLAARAAMDKAATEMLKCQIADSLGEESSVETREVIMRAIDLLNRVQ